MERLKRITPYALLLAILAVAALLRFRGLGESPVAGDQSVLLSIALRFVRQGWPMLPLAANKSSAGIMNPPLITYLLALPLFVRTTLLAPHLFQALLSTLAVPLLYGMAARLFNRRVGLLAALLFAVNPWAVYYGRFIWNPNPIPLFSTLLLGSLLAALVGGSRIRRPAVHLALVPLWLAAITQLHLGSLVLIPTVALILLLFYRRWWRGWQWRSFAPLAVGLGLALLLYLPFLIFERAVGFSDLRAVFGALTGSADGVGAAETNLASWLLTLELASGSHIFAATGVPRDAVWPLYGLFDMAQLLVACGLLVALVRPLRRRAAAGSAPMQRRRTEALLILAVWTLLPALLLLRHTVYLQNYYFLFLFPAPFLLLALLADELLQRLEARLAAAPARAPLRRTLSLLLLAPLLLLAAWQAHISLVRLTLLARGEIGEERPLRDIEHAVETSRAVLAAAPGCDLLIVDEGGTPESSRLGLLEPLVYPAPVRLMDAGRGYIVPDGCAVYLLSVADPLLESWLAAAATPLPQQVRTGGDTWRFYRVDAKAADDEAPAAPLAVWQNGLNLVDVDLPDAAAPGERLSLTTTWRVTAVQPDGAQVHFFNHLVDEAGQIVAQEDAAAVAAAYWRPGDRLVAQFHLQLPVELPAGTYTVYAGLYTWPDLNRITLASGETTLPLQTVTVR